MYDFLSALTALDPHHTYTTTPLSGGLVNITVRIFISSATKKHECIFAQAETVIGKYAPAYVAALGESTPLSQYRQVIEARALGLLSQPPINAYIQPILTTPKLIHHDPISYMLLMSDLGAIPALDEWLSSNESNRERAEFVGEQVGKFFARLAGVSELVVKANTQLNLSAHFSNPSAHDLIRSVAILPIEPNLIACGIDPSEAAVLGKACLDTHDRQRTPGRAKVFGLGDCWPKSLLVGPEPSVIDWEFAGMIEPLTDLAQLTAHLFLLYRTSSSVEVRLKVKSFGESMLRTHYEHSQPWQYALEHRVDAWRLFGGEVINNACETDWWDGDVKRKEAGMGELGMIGAGYIRHAEERGKHDGMLFGDIFECEW